MRLTKLLTLPVLLIPCLGHADPGEIIAKLDTAVPMNEMLHYPAMEMPSARGQAQIGESGSGNRAKTYVMPHYGQETGSLNALGNADDFRTHAAIQVQNLLKSRHLDLMEYRFTDTNADGSQEIVSLSGMENAQHQKYFVVSVYDFDENLAPILRYEKKQPIPDNKGKHDASRKQAYQQHIEASEPGFSFCEEWRIASWQIHECHLIQFDRAWMPRVMRHDIETAEPQAHSAQMNSFNFGSKIASRAYSRLPEGTFMPALSRNTQYVMVFAPINETADRGPARLEYEQFSAFSDHTPFRFGAAWNSGGIYFSFDFTDENLIAPTSCTESIAIQQVDHAELWFDLNPSLKIDRNNPDSWMLEYEKDYQNEPYRHHLDSDVFGLAITPNGCIVPMSPTRDQWPVMPEVNYESTDYGYRLDVYIPAKFYGVEDISQMNRSLGLGFTARQHDFDGEYRYSETSTSEFRWPDPFTFGELWLKPSSAAYPPHYPLQWNDWLDK